MSHFRPILLTLGWFSTWASMLLAAPIDLGDRRELMVDTFLIEEMDRVRLVMGTPRRAEVVLQFDQPWEYAAGFVTVIKDGPKYRMYYRGGSKNTEGILDTKTEVVVYAESDDGIRWVKPALGLHEYFGHTGTNIIIGPGPNREGHNFAPFLDDRPDVPAEERYKAVAGKGPTGGASPGLFRFVSADGVNWRPFSPDPLFTGYALDSLNVLTWVHEEQCYAIYLRTWSEGGTPDEPRFRGFRTVSRSTSKDFINWTKPEPMGFGDTPLEHLYTNNTQPYFRAPHLLVSLPFRLWPRRPALTEERLAELGVPPNHARGLSDAVLMTSRGGLQYDRTFMESFVRPGLDPVAWHARETSPSNGVVPITEHEMSFYVVNHYPMPTQHLTRMVLRTDGFASARAGYTPGTLLTKPLTFRGDRLELNFSTSAAGSVKVELLDLAGSVLAVSEELIGDEIARDVQWEERAGVGEYAGRPVRLRFTLKDADLYSFRFAD
jgi:hypothetical protein